MFKLNVLCAGFMLSSTAALLGLSFYGTQDSVEKMIEDAIKQGASESTQRTVDGLAHVAFSEKHKKRNERFSEEVIQLFVKNISEFMVDVMDEITPEDAQELLPVLDSVYAVAHQAIDFLPNADKKSDEENIIAATLLQLHMKMALLQVVKYLPALEKHKNVVQEKQQGAVDEAVQFTAEALNNSYLEIRAIVEQKARS